MNVKNAYKVFGEKPLTSGILASSSPTKLEENLFLYRHGNDHEKKHRQTVRFGNRHNTN
jgi:hypothetical protein